MEDAKRYHATQTIRQQIYAYTNRWGPEALATVVRQVLTELDEQDALESPPHTPHRSADR